MTMSRALLLVAVLVGLLIGLSGYTFVYARGYSYLSNDPGACANCHVMRDHFAAWTREPSDGRRLQRLSYATGMEWEVRHESSKRVLALVLFHDRPLS